MFTQVEIWDGYDIMLMDDVDDDDGNVRWYNHPWNPKNNVNYTTNQTTLPKVWSKGWRDGSQHPFHLTVPDLNDDAIVLEFQKAFIEKVLSYSLQYDHALYQIGNEDWWTAEWTNYWAKFIHRQAEQVGRSVYVARSPLKVARWQSDSLPNPDYPGVASVLEFPELYNFADISQTGIEHGESHMRLVRESWEKTQDRPVPLNSSKQYGADTSHPIHWFGDTDEAIDRFVRSIFGGQAAVRFHRYSWGVRPIARLNAVLICSTY